MATPSNPRTTSPPRRFGALLLPAIFTDSALGVLGSGQSGSAFDGTATLHVAFGIGLIALAGWALGVAAVHGTWLGRGVAGLTVSSLLSAALAASISGGLGLPQPVVAERALAIIALLGASGMILVPSRVSTASPTVVPASKRVPHLPIRTPLGSAVRAGLVIVVLFLWFQAAATVAVVAVGLPSEFSVTWPLLVAGAALALAGVILASWVFVYRHPVLMIQSTGATFSRLLGESTPSGRAAPVEPLALLGPHRWVRHPLYLSLILSLVGWAVFTQSSITLLEAGLFVMWFVLVEIPFEEAELRALYGAPYERYSQRTPQLIPFMPSRWPPTGSGR